MIPAGVPGSPGPCTCALLIALVRLIDVKLTCAVLLTVSTTIVPMPEPGDAFIGVSCCASAVTFNVIVAGTPADWPSPGAAQRTRKAGAAMPSRQASEGGVAIMALCCSSMLVDRLGGRAARGRRRGRLLT